MSPKYLMNVLVNFLLLFAVIANVSLPAICRVRKKTVGLTVDAATPSTEQRWRQFRTRRWMFWWLAEDGRAWSCVNTPKKTTWVCGFLSNATTSAAFGVTPTISAFRRSWRQQGCLLLPVWPRWVIFPCRKILEISHNTSMCLSTWRPTVPASS